MARTLSQIIAELKPTYAPQEKALRERQALIPQQIAEEEKGLQAKQTQAFGDIVSGARRRGLGFSGIPLSEQAQYTSTEFLPALARLRGQGREQALSLEEAILGIGERRNTLAQQLRQGELDRAEQQRQFNKNLQLQREQMRQQERLARSSGGGGGGGDIMATLGSIFGGGGGSTKKTPEWQQTAFNDVKTRIDRAQNINELKSDFNATYSSAIRGNRKDQAKIMLYQKYRPDLFSANKLFTGPSAAAVRRAFQNNVKKWGIKL